MSESTAVAVRSSNSTSGLPVSSLRESALPALQRAYAKPAYEKPTAAPTAPTEPGVVLTHAHDGHNHSHSSGSHTQSPSEKSSSNRVTPPEAPAAARGQITLKTGTVAYPPANGQQEAQLRAEAEKDPQVAAQLRQLLQNDPKVKALIKQINDLSGKRLDEGVAKALVSKLLGEKDFVPKQKGLFTWVTTGEMEKLVERFKTVYSGLSDQMSREYGKLGFFGGGVASLLKLPEKLDAKAVLGDDRLAHAWKLVVQTSPNMKTELVSFTSGGNNQQESLFAQLFKAEEELRQRAEKAKAALNVSLTSNNSATSAFVPSNFVSRALDSLTRLIKSGEGGYNSMNQGTRGNQIVGSTNDSRQYLGKLLTEMTIGEIKDRQRSGQLFAAGAYQIIPSTMPQAVAAAGLSDSDMFSPENQEKMGAALLFQKRPYLGEYLKGKHNDLRGAMMELAREFASIPNPDTGRSYYGSGNASHHAVSTVKAVLQQARQSFAAGSGGSGQTSFV